MSVWPTLGALDQDAPALVFGDTPPDPEVLPFDPTLPYTRTDNMMINRGCPVGYFAQFVPAGTDSAVFVQIPNLVQGSYIRCRKMAGYTSAVNAAETGQAAAQSWYTFTNEGVGAGFKDLLDKLGLVGKIALGVAVAMIVREIIPRR